MRATGMNVLLSATLTGTRRSLSRSPARRALSRPRARNSNYFVKVPMVKVSAVKSRSFVELGALVRQLGLT